MSDQSDDTQRLIDSLRQENAHCRERLAAMESGETFAELRRLVENLRELLKEKDARI